jgi:CRISPR type III-B/RAMP module RAMP protein Cmr6
MNTRHHTTETALELVNAQGSLLLGHCTSRSLRLTRYADPSLEKDDRNGYLSRVVSATSPANEPQRHEDGINSWKRWLTATARPEHQIHAKLEARLLINMGGTVLENAGLQLDRFGTAYLPGSAVKACARRTALATLRQWCETLTDGQPTKPTAADDALAPACAHADFKTPSDLLLAILRVFGCTDLEWKRYDYDNNKGNDLAWACANQWDSLSPTARDQLPSDTLRGSVAFLPAYPYSRLPVDLELDVLTSHHQKYYRGDLDTATDTEDPIPVYFPAVAADAIYTFAVLPVGATAADSPLLTHAKIWLSTGLTVFGLGAKTAAGYGFFSDATPAISERESKAREQARIAAEAASLKAKQAADLAARKAREAALAAMTPAQRADAELADRATDWGWMKPHLAKFAQHPPETQAALLRWFCGAGRDRWLSEIKPDSAKGKKPWSQIIANIHATKKAHKIDLP